GLASMSLTDDIIVHENPAWREYANFIIMAKIKHKGKLAEWHREQLWARQLATDRFEICCIPFFIYDLALGDEVQTGREESNEYMVQKVLRQSDHYTFRAWFYDPNAKAHVAEQL